METPEKIYLQVCGDCKDNDCKNCKFEDLKDNVTWCKDKIFDKDIEYIRTDVFIEKACEWLEKNADKYIWYSDYAEYPGDETCGMNDDFIEDFQKYMKGE